MDPREIASRITDDPDVLNEGYCEACGGWDKEQGGSGHKMGCPDGEPGASIAYPETITTLLDRAAEQGFKLISGLFDSKSNNVYHIFALAKNPDAWEPYKAPRHMGDADAWEIATVFDDYLTNENAFGKMIYDPESVCPSCSQAHDGDYVECPYCGEEEPPGGWPPQSPNTKKYELITPDEIDELQTGSGLDFKTRIKQILDGTAKRFIMNRAD